MKNLKVMEKSRRKFQFASKSMLTIPNKSDDYLNKISADFRRSLFIMGTENGNVIIYKKYFAKEYKILKSEEWISALKGYYPNIWISGMSRAVKAVRISDNATIFHLNMNEEMQNFGSKLKF